MVKYIWAVFVLAIASLLFSACGNSIGYGVVLWGEKGSPFKTGDIVTLSSMAGTSQDYIVQEKSGDKKVILPGWRVEFFKDRGESEKFVKEYMPYFNLYAYSEKEGVPPVREKPDTNNQVSILYKLKQYQVVKVIGRDRDKTVISEMEDYWYKILVGYQKSELGGDGLLVGKQGYCFGHYLKTFETAGDPEEYDFSAGSESLTFLDHFFSKTWRPISFREMVSARRIDLSQFRDTMGLFPLKDENKIKIVTEKGARTFIFTQASEIKTNVYLFQGTSLRVEKIDNDMISATYPIDNATVTEQFILFEDGMDEIIKGEQERRDAIFTDFSSRGLTLSSSAYGRIVLDNDKNYTWTGFEKLVPNVLPSGYSGTGRIDFPFHLGSALRDDYDGVISFYNDKLPKENRNISFIYKFKDNGVRLYSLSVDSIEDLLVKRMESSAIIIFFEFRGN